MGKFIDLTGQHFGEWTVLERDDSVKKKNIYWKCQCSCGTIRSVAGTSLRGGISVSCGCEKDRKTSERTKKQTEDLSGRIFGEWTVLYQDFSEDNRTASHGARWICRCSCGKEKSVLGYALKAGRTTNCGHKNSDIHRENLMGKVFGKLTVIQFAGYEVSDGGYSRTKWKCRCMCGNVIEVLSKRLKNGEVTSCGCVKNRVRRSIIEIGHQYGYWTVLSLDEEKREKGKYYWCKCQCGNLKSVSADSLQRGTSKSCGCMRSNYNDLVGHRFGELIVLERDTNMYGKGVYWKCRCSCGNIKSYRTNTLKSGAVISCGCKSREMTSVRKTVDLVGQKFGRLTVLTLCDKKTDKQGNSSNYWDCICECGNHKIVSTSSLTGGYTKSCGCLQSEESARRAKSRLVDITGKRFGILTVIKRIECDDSNSGEGTWECKCDCGKIKYAGGYYLRKGMITSCGCLNQSKYELYVSEYLCKRDFSVPEDFEPQKRFEDLRGVGSGKLSYDFALYNNGELYLLIECQGKQHYQPIEVFGGEKQFQKQLEHDRLKREYANILGVPLLEIPYTEDTYEKVAAILAEYVKDK